jgi:hypothetical protein
MEELRDYIFKVPNFPILLKMGEPMKNLLMALNDQGPVL